MSLESLPIQAILFYLFAGLCIASALGVVFHKNPVSSAVLLVLTFFSLAAIYAIMNAVFLATMQVLVYAGAIMVLVVFVVMLLSLRQESALELWNKPFKKVFIIFVSFAFGALLVSAIGFGVPNLNSNPKGYTTVLKKDLTAADPTATEVTGGPSRNASSDSNSRKKNIVELEYSYPVQGTSEVSAKGNIAAVGASIFIDYLVPFEMISILLLISVVGAVLLAKRNVE